MGVNRFTQALLQAALLLEPSSTHCCPVCLNLVAFELHPVDHFTAKVPLLERLRNEHPEFFSACIAFLTSPMNDASLPELRRRLVANTAQCIHGDTHYKEIRSNFKDPVYVVVEACYLAIYAALANGKHRLINRQKIPSGFGAKRGRWPADVGELYPRGDVESIDAHLFWCSKRFSSAPLSVLNVMLNLARPYTFPHLVDDARRAKVVYIICQLLHGNPAMIPTGWDGAFPISPPVDVDSPLSAPDQERLQLHAATDFLGIVATGLDAHIVQDLGLFYRGYEKPLFHATHSAAARIDTRHGGYQTLCQVVSSTYDFAGVDRSRLNPRVLASVGPDRDTQTEDPEKDGNSMPGVTRAYLSQLARARTCSGPNCTKTIYEEGRPFPVCSRCKTVRYCGPECQKRDWSSAQVAHRHKDICPLLRQLLAEANPTMNNEQWAKAFVHTLDIEAQWKLFEWAIDGPLFSEGSKRRMKQFLQRMKDYTEHVLRQPPDVADEMIRQLGETGTTELTEMLQRGHFVTAVSD